MTLSVNRAINKAHGGIMKLFISIAIALFAVNGQSAFVADQIYDGKTLQQVNLAQILDQSQKGQVFIVSEFHGVVKTHDTQREVLKGLMARNFKVNMAIEHFSYLEQNAIDAYLNKNLTEKALLKTVQLSDFENWREQFFLPLQSGGWSYGLNAPRWLTGKMNAIGYDLLADLEKQILPPDFTLGNKIYAQRFLEAMGMIHPFEGFDNLFAAQSAWDDTSAWTLARLQKNDPDSIFVVLFGDFHVIYNSGLTDRLAQRGVKNVVTISQFCLNDLTDAEIEAQMKPHPVYGQRADYIRPVNCQN